MAAGTGHAPDHHDGGVQAAGATDARADTATYMVEHEGDLHEYGLSLGVDLDAEAEEDLAWVVREAFNAPLPGSWTEYMDDTGRAYYTKEGSTESTWEHPMDMVYRELLNLIKETRLRHPPATEAQREELVKQHFNEVHSRARADVEGWSGPYPSEQGEYYYNDRLGVSSWDSPVAQWEQELLLRHAVLSRCLLPEQASVAPGAASGASSHRMLQAFRLQLGNLHTSAGGLGGGGLDCAVPEPSTSRSYHTARSHCSSRSGRSKTSKEHKERKSDKHRSSEERKADREARHAAAAGAAGSALPEGTPAYYPAGADGPPMPFSPAD